MIRSIAARIAVAIALPALALLVSEILRPWLEPSFYTLFLVATAASTLCCGARYGFASPIISSLTLDYFFLPPIRSLAIEDVSSEVQLILFAALSSVLIGLIHYARDVRARFFESEERYRSLSELIPFGAWTADPRGNMVGLSESFLKTFGTTLEECRGLGWMRLLEEAQRPQILADWRECVRNGYFWDYEYHMRAKSGESYVVLSRGVPVPDARGGRRTWVGIHLDITERERSAEQRIAQARDIARFNAELEQFAYVSAHDLQEPLRMIASYLQLLSRRYKGTIDAEADTFISYAVEGAERLQSLLQDLLELQQVGKGGREKAVAPLGLAVDKACQNLALKIEHTGAEITCADLPVVEYEEQAMVQLFVHLIDNALKYRRAEARPEIRISAVREPYSTHWSILVKDNGIGIPKEFQKKVFDIFQRLHPRQTYPGTGIGLAICKKIVEVHGGQIHVESAPGEGSTFCFTLPVSRKLAR